MSFSPPFSTLFHSIPRPWFVPTPMFALHLLITGPKHMAFLHISSAHHQHLNFKVVCIKGRANFLQYLYVRSGKTLSPGVQSPEIESTITGSQMKVKSSYNLLLCYRFTHHECSLLISLCNDLFSVNLLENLCSFL